MLGQLSHGTLARNRKTEKPLLRREVLGSYPHLFSWKKFSCQTPIVDESSDSGHSPSFEDRAKRREVYAFFPNDSWPGMDPRSQIRDQGLKWAISRIVCDRICSSLKPPRPHDLACRK